MKKLLIIVIVLFASCAKIGVIQSVERPTSSSAKGNVNITNTKNNKTDILTNTNLWPKNVKVMPKYTVKYRGNKIISIIDKKKN